MNDLRTMVSIILLLGLALLNMAWALGELLPSVPFRRRLSAACGVLGAVGLVQSAWSIGDH